jgi:hypothetical protein
MPSLQSHTADPAPPFNTSSARTHSAAPPDSAAASLPRPAFASIIALSGVVTTMPGSSCNQLSMLIPICPCRRPPNTKILFRVRWDVGFRSAIQGSNPMGHADALPPWHRLVPHPCLTACPSSGHHHGCRDPASIFSCFSIWDSQFLGGGKPPNPQPLFRPHGWIRRKPGGAREESIPRPISQNPQMPILSSLVHRWFRGSNTCAFWKSTKHNKHNRGVPAKRCCSIRIQIINIW